MKKILVLISILSVLLVACSSSPTKRLKVNGKMRMVILSLLKVNRLKSQLTVKLQKDQ